MGWCARCAGPCRFSIQTTVSAVLDERTATGQDHTDAMIALMTQVTQGLGQIENPEVLQLNTAPTSKTE